MANKVKRVYQSTVQLIEVLEDSELDRDGKIRRVQEFLTKREDEMQVLAPPYSEEEMAVGKQLVKLNGRLTALLERERLMIQRDIKGLHAKKASSQKYLNPYQSLTAGGVLYDKKK